MSDFKGSRPTVNNLRSLGNFTQMFRWMVQIAEFPKALSKDYKTDDINFRAESMSIPEQTGETTTISIRGNEVRQPGIYRWNSPITLTLVETTDILVNKFIWDWMNLCWLTGDTKAGSPGVTEDSADLKASIYLHQLDNMDGIIYTHYVYGCFIENATLGQFDSSTSDPQKPEISLAYDYAVRVKNDTGGDYKSVGSHTHGKANPVEH